jgi:DNA-binding MarR family transcriptional regulator
MGYLIDYLEQRGYLERRADPTDRRATLVFATERGWQQIRAALSVITTIEEEWSRRLGPKRMHQLRELLSQLAAEPEPDAKIAEGNLRHPKP